MDKNYNKLIKKLQGKKKGSIFLYQQQFYIRPKMKMLFKFGKSL